MNAVQNGLEIPRDQLLQVIMNALQSWSDLHRRIFIDIHYGGRSAAEVAQVLGMPQEEITRILELCSSSLNGALKVRRQATGEGMPGFPFREQSHAAACCCH